MKPRTLIVASSIALAVITAGYGIKEFLAVAQRNGYWRSIPPTAAAVGVTGPWCVNSLPASISLAGGRLTIHNENGMVTPGRFKNPQTIVAIDWGPLEGSIVNGGKDIVWHNGTIWHREFPCR